ncbi:MULTISPECIES: polyhydroxyalkanoate synthesis regulator DNA-binding domain-containing protein [unclassified Frankia]|uniref:polyhydroxyalkanoate synthesis regulator DNA-binding domain-containing protein n=1 Tax=unclassified Frankia TaxID=2632575 RepID=UPI002024A33D
MSLNQRRTPRPPRGHYRRLRRDSDGSLYDINEHRRIPLSEIREDIQAGRRFRAVRDGSGEDCTNQVLADALKGALVDKVGLQTGIPASLSAIAGSLLSALDKRDNGGGMTSHNGLTSHRSLRGQRGNSFPGTGDENRTIPGRD